MSEPLAVVTNHESMVEAFRLAKELRGLSNRVCDSLGGLTDGATDKILGPSRTKNLGLMTIDVFCKMFAVRFIMVPDMEAEAEMKARWEGRDSSNVRVNTKRLSKVLLERAKPIIAIENGRKGGLARLKWPREVRVKMARRAVVMRWRRKRRELRAMKEVPVLECT